MTNLKIGIYEHFKGNLYQVTAVARHSETEELFVVYHPLETPTNLWVRPIEMFTAVIEKDGVKLPRFKWVKK